jgi:hypothetical protein
MAEPQSVDLTSRDDLPCPECRRNTLVLVTAQLRTDEAVRPAGGWAFCRSGDCLATPHPLWEDRHG